MQPNSALNLTVTPLAFARVAPAGQRNVRLTTRYSIKQECKGDSMNIQGAVIGLVAFVIIGIFHPIVVKSEYYFGIRVWPLFLIAGISSIIISLFIADTVLSAVVGIFGFSSLWSIRELHEQVERVQKGWFPKNPNR
jgi:hypothetical protein